MYNDLPSINVVHRESPGRLDSQCSMTLRHHYSDWDRELGGSPSWSNGHVQQIPITDGLTCPDHFKVSSWLPLAVKREPIGSQYPRPIGDLVTRTWKPCSPSRSCVRSDAEESLASDHGSLSSSWRLEDTEADSRCRNMVGECSTNPKRGVRTFDSWSYVASNRDCVCSTKAAIDTKIERHDFGVTLQDVQQLPDNYAITNPDDDAMSLIGCDDQGVLLECSSVSASSMSSTRSSLSSQQLEARFDNGPRDSYNRLCDLDASSRSHESDSDSEYQNRASKNSRRFVEKKVRPIKGLKHTKKPTTPSMSRVSKYRNRHSSQQAVNNAMAREQSVKSPCPDCEFEAASKSALRKHTLTVHIRPFTCSFRIYGCSATFGSKNEWKRHVSSQHLRLGFWRCDLDGCLPSDGLHGKLSGAANGSTREFSEEVVTFNDFNRKDLFTQHLRRMHAPGRGASKTIRDSFNISLAATCTRCWITLRGPPVFRTCGFCEQEEPFKCDDLGKIATWETRMEHVGRHLEAGHGKSRVWHEDMVLRDWMAENRLIKQGKNGAWTLTGLQRGKSKVPKIADNRVS